MHAADGEVMIAYAMNGKPLPPLNGFPLKLIVPAGMLPIGSGCFMRFEVHADTFKGYWYG
jgi:DMSO/TMAO reductase YedYZ molybdopterin-dependent catalytic subunit